MCKGGIGLQGKRSKQMYRLTATAAAAAAMAVLAPWSVPMGPVPVSLCTLLIYLMACLLGPRQAASAVAVYVLMGAAGLPVFSGFLGGMGRVAGPTGGYIVGYLPLAAITAAFAGRAHGRRGAYFVGMVLGTALLYGLGTLWYCVQSGTAPVAALAVCVLPFLPGDGVKMLAALALGPVLRDRLERAGQLER